MYFLSQVRAYLMERKKREWIHKRLKQAVKMIIEAVGEDANREGLQETPARVARMYQEIFSGLAKLLRNTCQNPLRLSTIIWL